eukprot:3365680-Rhodomonas_salina.5
MPGTDVLDAATTWLVLIMGIPLPGARASSTGRVEAYWIAFKCAQVGSALALICSVVPGTDLFCCTARLYQSFLMYFSVYVKPITCVSILFIMSMIQGAKSTAIPSLRIPYFSQMHLISRSCATLGTGLGWDVSSYAMCGTGLGYAASSVRYWPRLCCYQCAVLT